ncbi:MAG: hypothetical protein KF889_19590 [Alphaproteobacteria bacterium]|nr:hypothetical protein [Alphaproteobacteria bacterium]MCW5744349.1 hypothetical protein [Alphaproteobacteria bacterium]
MADDQIPYGLWFRRYAPFATFGSIGIGEFEGDTRTQASGSISDTSRTYGCVLFSRTEAVRAYGGSSGTILFPKLGGPIHGMAAVKTTFRKGASKTSGTIAFSAGTEGGNPLVPGAPEIDTIVSVEVDFSRPGRMEISGEVFGDNFPNLEVFVYCYRSRTSAILVDGRTTGGRNSGPGSRLFGSHATHRIARFDVSLSLDSSGRLTGAYKPPATSLTEYPSVKPLQREMGLKL